MTDDLVKRLRLGNTAHVDARIWMYDAADRIEELEAKLAVAVAALSYYANHEILFLYDDASFARDTIAELTGGKDYTL